MTERLEAKKKTAGATCRLVRGSVAALALWSLCSPVQSAWSPFGVLDDRQNMSSHLRDRQFEIDTYRLLESDPALSGFPDIQIWRFGNTILILGQVPSKNARDAVDETVLRASGVIRKDESAPDVEAASDRDCGGKQVIGNTRRRSIVNSDKPCSSLDAEPDTPTQGRVFNHLTLGPGRSGREQAQDQLIVARVKAHLVNNGLEAIVDTRRAQLTAQAGTVFLMGNLSAAERSSLLEEILRLDGVTAVVDYSEP